MTNNNNNLNDLFILDECVDDAFSHLKCGISEGTSTLRYRLIHALAALCRSLASLFTTILRHDCMCPNHSKSAFLFSTPRSIKIPPFLTIYLAISSIISTRKMNRSHLFTIDDLVNNLPNLGVGCFWGSHLAEALGYADDVVSLAPSPAALRMML